MDEKTDAVDGAEGCRIKVFAEEEADESGVGGKPGGESGPADEEHELVRLVARAERRVGELTARLRGDCPEMELEPDTAA